MAQTVVQLQGLRKTFGSGAAQVEALKGIDLEIARGEFTAFAGPSGSGKTTLLNLVGGLDRPTEGSVHIEGTDLGSLSEGELSDLRRDRVGFIFQAYNLVPVLKAGENIEYVMLLQGVDADERRQRVEAILEEVGLKGMAERFPHQLSGGQQQRVAVARAIVSRPALILADEPTANLDSENSENLLALMGELNRNHQTTFLFSTHDKRIMDHARRLIRLTDGQITEDEERG